MGRPRQWLRLHIGGQEWVVYLASRRSKFLRQDGKQHEGLCFYDQCKIYICRDDDEQVIQDTLLHELFHALIYVCGGTTAMHNFCVDAAAAAKLEETLVGGMTPIFHRLLKDLQFQFPVVN